ncbi:hypothetical protein M6B38_316115 [Iris pallida]|uniref:Uncharacterized protein n=1 Tax=Iris pallida TaxID=29817 RepID=A0AAX6HE50_IRIPA|nr:hypothetical protein M6B38_316115 [Iris pallida]
MKNKKMIRVDWGRNLPRCGRDVDPLVDPETLVARRGRPQIWQLLQAFVGDCASRGGSVMARPGGLTPVDPANGGSRQRSTTDLSFYDLDW